MTTYICIIVFSSYVHGITCIIGLITSSIHKKSFDSWHELVVMALGACDGATPSGQAKSC